jgi:hypothetical protein
MNLLGPDKVSGQFLFSLRTFDPKTTLTHLYSHANAVNDLTPGRTDKQALDKIRDLAEKYIDSLEQKTIADTTRIVANKLEDAATEAKIQGIEPSDYLRQEDGKKILSSIEKELQEQRKKINRATELLVNHELHTSQNLGAFDGILSAARSIGVDDPVIFKIGVSDEYRCKFCWKLWTMPDKKTPKVYKLSELSGNPGNWKDPAASISPTHINCRDVMTILMPGFGFEGSKIVYKGKDHDEYKKQRGGS